MNREEHTCRPAVALTCRKTDGNFFAACIVHQTARERLMCVYNIYLCSSSLLIVGSQSKSQWQTLYIIYKTFMLYFKVQNDIKYVYK